MWIRVAKFFLRLETINQRGKNEEKMELNDSIKYTKIINYLGNHGKKMIAKHS